MDPGSVVLPALAEASVRALCLALVGTLAIWICRVRSVSIQHAVWTATLGAMLLLPLLKPILPAIPLPVFVEVAAEPQPVRPVWLPPTGPTVVSVPPIRRSPVLDIYAGVLLAMLLRLLVASLLVRRLVRRSAPAGDDRARMLLERFAGGRAPRLLESRWIWVPMTAGWFRPAILLPSGWREWDEAKLQAALAHELSHVQRRDPLVALIAGLNKCVFWFHPLAWWMERKLAALAEQAADDSSVLALGDRERYAAALVEMAAARAGRGRLVWEGVAMAKSSEVRRRIDRILDETSVISRGITKGRWAAVVFAAVPLLYGAAAIQLETMRIPAPVAMQPQLSPAPQPIVKPSSPYEKWLQEDVVYIITAEERAAFERLSTGEEREQFIEQFWLRRDPTPGTVANEVKEEHYRRIAYANDRFSSRKPGWKTDRGRAYITLGPPDEIESHPSGRGANPPYEIWRYKNNGGGTPLEMEFVDSEWSGEYRVTPSSAIEKTNFEIRIPLDPRSLEFRETDGQRQATVNVYGRVRDARRRPVCVFEEVLQLKLPSEPANDAPLWFRKNVSIAPGDYSLNLMIRDATTRLVESREMTLSVPAGSEQVRKTSSGADPRPHAATTPEADTIQMFSVTPVPRRSQGEYLRDFMDYLKAIRDQQSALRLTRPGWHLHSTSPRDVPKVRQVKDSAEELPVVSLAKDGKLYLNNHPVNINELATSIVKRFGEGQAVYVVGEKELTRDTLAQVIRALEKARIKVNVVTQPTDERERRRR